MTDIQIDGEGATGEVGRLSSVSSVLLAGLGEGF